MQMHEIINRMDTLSCCHEAIAILLNPDGDLQTYQREKVCMLMGFINDEYAISRDLLGVAMGEADGGVQ